MQRRNKEQMQKFVELIGDLWDSGLSDEKIAAELGTPIYTIRAIRAKHDFQRVPASRICDTINEYWRNKTGRSEKMVFRGAGTLRTRLVNGLPDYDNHNGSRI